MAASTIYISAGLPVAKASGQSPTAGEITAYLSAGLAPVVQSGTTCTLSGTALTDSIDRDDVRDGGKTIILTLTNDTWHTKVGDDEAETDALIAGIDSAQSEAAGWDAIVKANMVYGDVTRTSDTVVTIILAAEAAYEITATETITATIPATCLNASGDAVEASPTFTVDAVASGLGIPIAMHHYKQMAGAN